jgi:hypothetical protein
MSFRMCSFEFFFQHHIREQIFNTLSTNLHLNSLQLNPIELNLNPIIELHSVELELKLD